MSKCTKECNDWIEKYIRKKDICGMFNDQGKLYVSYYLFPDGSSDTVLYLKEHPEERDDVLFGGKYKMIEEIPYPPKKIY